MRELELIDALEKVFTCDDPRVVRWLGDDAAVVRARGYAVTSVDTAVDGVHFRSGELSPREIGHHALASALSDLAAMGADPGEAYLALGVPSGFARAAALGVPAFGGCGRLEYAQLGTLLMSRIAVRPAASAACTAASRPPQE